MTLHAFKTIAVASFMGTLAACSTTGTSGGGAEASQAGSEAPVAAQVAVFNEIFRDNASALKDTAQSYCIATGPQEAKTVDPAVLTALGGNPKVKPRSSCDIDPNGGRVVDRQTGKPSLLFNVDTVSCVSNRECLITGGYYEGNASSQTSRYKARLVDGAWNVTFDETGPIS